MEIKRLGTAHYDALIELLNAVFSRKNGRVMDFEKEIPKMCVRDEAHMTRHFGIFEGNRLAAAMGVYPFETVVAGQNLRFATAGNVAVHWDFEGRGYMHAMMEYAMDELCRLDADAARLGGLRSRYNRYGFEACGQNYTFTFTAKNRERKCPGCGDGVSFVKITPDDTAALSFAAALYNENAIAVPRTAEDAYLCMTTWKNTPYLAVRRGIPVGYVSANETGSSIAEIAAQTTDALTDTVCAWQARVGANISFTLPAHRMDAVRVFSAVTESSVISSPCHFKIRHWDRVTDAFMKLKASYCPMVPGELAVGIEGWGTLRLFVKGGEAGCVRTDDCPDVTLDPLSAARFLFGPYPPICTADAPPVAQAWFPLPLSWNGQDRV